MQKVRELFQGAALTFEGIKLFYLDKSLWKYAVAPLLPVLVVYLFLGYAAVWAVRVFSAYMSDLCAELPKVLQLLATAASGASCLIVFLIFLLIVIICTSTLYELFGGLFFDALLERFAGNLCPEKLQKSSWHFNVQAIVDSIFYSSGTLLLIIGCFILSMILPVIGHIIGIVIISYRFGVSYLAMTGFHCAGTLRQTRQMARSRYMLVMGYGASIYLIYLFPLAVLFMLPGIILGGVLVYKSITNKT